MAKFKFELNTKGVKELMQSKEMQDVLVSRADEVKKNAGDGYTVYVGKTRANVSVGTATDSAQRDNLENNTLLKAVD